MTTHCIQNDFAVIEYLVEVQIIVDNNMTVQEAQLVCANVKRVIQVNSIYIPILLKILDFLFNGTLIMPASWNFKPRTFSAPPSRLRFLCLYLNSSTFQIALCLRFAQPRSRYQT